MSRRLREPVDPRPFVTWCYQRVEQLRARPGEEAPALALLAEIGWPESIGNGLRRLRRWRDEKTAVERAVVEDALNAAGLDWWEVYGPDPVGDERWCHSCGEMVAVLGYRCCWCNRLTAAERPDLVEAVAA